MIVRILCLFLGGLSQEKSIDFLGHFVLPLHLSSVKIYLNISHIHVAESVRIDIFVIVSLLMK